MRHYECICQKCRTVKQQLFQQEPYPNINETFICFCNTCKSNQPHNRTITKKAIAESNINKQEKLLQENIKNECKKYGFSCRFLYQSVIISTPLFDWQFDYHQSKKTLFHESTIKIDFSTGDYAKSHIQFKNKKISNADIIFYISNHEKATVARNNSKKPV